MGETRYWRLGETRYWRLGETRYWRMGNNILETGRQDTGDWELDAREWERLDTGDWEASFWKLGPTNPLSITQ